MREKEGRKDAFIEYYDEHKKDYLNTLNLLEDEFSKESYKAIINYRRTMNIKYLDGITVYPQYFRKEIFAKSSPEIFIDCGGFIGDTAMDFSEYWSDNPDDRIYIWEPEEENKASIRRNLQNKKLSWEFVPYAVWNKNEKISFIGSKGGKSGISRILCLDEKDTLSYYVEARTIDEVHGLGGEIGLDNITFIKMDIEGAEQNALRGAEKLIKKYKPKLAICIYHSYEDLWKIPQMLKEMVPEYHLFIRHHSDVHAETVVYARV